MILFVFQVLPSECLGLESGPLFSLFASCGADCTAGFCFTFVSPSSPLKCCKSFRSLTQDTRFTDTLNFKVWTSDSEVASSLSGRQTQSLSLARQMTKAIRQSLAIRQSPAIRATNTIKFHYSIIAFTRLEITYQISQIDIASDGGKYDFSILFQKVLFFKVLRNPWIAERRSLWIIRLLV